MKRDDFVSEMRRAVELEERDRAGEAVELLLALAAKARIAVRASDQVTDWDAEQALGLAATFAERAGDLARAATLAATQVDELEPQARYYGRAAAEAAARAALCRLKAGDADGGLKVGERALALYARWVAPLPSWVFEDLSCAMRETLEPKKKARAPKKKRARKS